MAICVKADGAHLVFTLKSGLVQRFDVVEFMDEFIRTLGDLPVRQGVEHEGIVRIRTMGDADRSGHWFLFSKNVVFVRVYASEGVR